MESNRAGMAIGFGGGPRRGSACRPRENELGHTLAPQLLFPAAPQFSLAPSYSSRFHPARSQNRPACAVLLALSPGQLIRLLADLLPGVERVDRGTVCSGLEAASKAKNKKCIWLPQKGDLSSIAGRVIAVQRAGLSGSALAAGRNALGGGQGPASVVM